jgi:hypothetical protein
MENMPAEATQLQGESGPKARLVAVDRLDQRTRNARAIRKLVRAYQADLARKPTAAEKAAMLRAAGLTVLASNALAGCLVGARGASFTEAVRLDNAARRALKDMRGARRKPKERSLQEILASAE